MKTSIFATGNPGKVREVKEILTGFHVITMMEAGLSPEIIEDGASFEENAVIKARAVYDAIKAREAAGDPAFDFAYCMADDSGLEIDYFDKKPGIYSSRWLGEDTSYDIKNGIVLSEMEDVPDEKRTARYVCSIAALDAEGTSTVVTEACEGIIGHEPKGEGGFGYDPIFYIPGLGTFAEISGAAKHEVSHRGKALRAILPLLKEI